MVINWLSKILKNFLFTILMLGSILFAELFLLCFINIHFYFMNIHWLLVMYDKVEYFSVFTFIWNLFDNTFFWSLRMTVCTLYYVIYKSLPLCYCVKCSTVYRIIFAPFIFRQSTVANSFVPLTPPHFPPFENPRYRLELKLFSN